MGGRWSSGVIAVALLAAPLAGCATADEGPQDAAVSFHHALQGGNGRAACGLVAEETRKALVQQEHKPCGAAILGERLPHPSGEGEAEIYGSMAQVVVDGETLFLSRFQDGWRIVAAGCPPTTGDAPHDCTLEAG